MFRLLDWTATPLAVDDPTGSGAYQPESHNPRPSSEHQLAGCDATVCAAAFGTV